MQGQGSKKLVLAAMIFAVAMMFIDQTIVAIAIPQLEKDLDLTATGAQWIVNGYLLALSALFAFGGKLTDVLGHRRMVYLEGPESSVSNRQRLLGLDDFVARTPGVRIDRMPAGAGAEDGRAAAAKVRSSKATAVLAYNDLVAIGLIDGLQEFGVTVPDDISVTGFDDSEVSRLVWPRLTTVRQPVFEMARDATARLVGQLEGEEPGPPRQHPHQLIVRDSTAAPSDGG